MTSRPNPQINGSSNLSSQTTGLQTKVTSDDSCPSVTWPERPTAEEWIKTRPADEWKQKFRQDGYLIVDGLLDEEELKIYQDVCFKMLRGEIDTSSHRHDLGNHEAPKQKEIENICQIMWPSIFVENLNKGPLHQRTKMLAKTVLGDDADFDFDMILSKGPHTNTPTPWHQDESYWPDVSDKRAVSCWVALDNVTKDTGCMWFVPGSHTMPLRQHQPQKEGCHVLTCEGSEDEGIAAEISAGSCTLHHGRTMHYTRGNSTDQQRRAFVAAYRPAGMVEVFRQRGFDHGKKKGVKPLLGTGQTHQVNT